MQARPQQSRGPAPLRPIPIRSQTLHRAHSLGPHADHGAGAPAAALLAGEALRGPGRPLDSATRSYMEPRFGYDFSNVRVHTDDKAALAARSINAVSYTSGTDIAFDSGRYAPHSAQGRQLLAHELTHVAQQSHGFADQGRTVAPANSAAEHEADRLSAAVASGGSVTGPISAGAAGIQRSAAGIAGGIVGGVLGGAVAAAAAEVLLRDARPLTGPEISEAKLVFGSSLDYNKVRVAESAVMAVGGYARTPFNTIYFPPGTQKEHSFADFMPWLIHEMTHTWQTQHGVSVFTKIGTAMGGAKAYNYGGVAGLQNATKEGRHFLSFNTEQQADICCDYYNLKKSNGDTSAYDPFITEVQHGGLPVNRRRDEPNDGVMPSGPNRMA